MTNEVAKKKQLPAFLVLTIICVIAALALAATNAVTKGPIEQHAADARAAAFGAVLEATAYEPVALEGVDKSVVLVEAWNKGEKVDALAGATVTSDAVIAAVNKAAKAENLTATAAGFQSDVTVTLTVDEAGLITGVTVDSSNETQGFGTRCAGDEAFLNQFIGKTAPFARVEGLVGYCVTASAKGYAGPVAVTLGVDKDGKIVGVKIGDNAFLESPGIGSKWLDPAQAEQFIGVDLKTGGAIDTIAGATVTSKAVKNAANLGAGALRGYLNMANDEPVFGEPKPIVYADGVAAGEYSVTGKGFQSDLKVTFTVDENSTITALTMDTSGETQGYGTRCGEDEGFVNQFIGKKVPVLEGDYDVLAGATITSTAVVKAINSVAIPGAEQPAVETAADASGDNAYEASSQGFQSDVKVTVYTDDAGVITGIKVDASGETQGFGTRCGEDEAFLNQFIGKTAPVEADVLTGATVTSNAVIAAVNAALPAPAAGEEKIGKAQGFQSEVTVILTVDAGVITGIKVDASGETQGLGTRCGEDEAFLNQFIGKKATPDLGEGIDALAGATVTSNAVIEAANAAIGVAVDEVEIPAANALTATVPAYDGQNITVTVTVDENGNVATLAVDASTQTPGLGQKCAEAEFVNQFIGQAGPFVLGENVDAVSYATITSQAVVDAVNSVLPAQESADAPAANELTATVPAYDGQNITVTVTVDENGNVATLAVDASTQTPGLGQ
ncbi:MAG: FMN-binding protein, partial [Clostridia bacterium]|nr:FMN-binding protein [Clostridia bacterium]